MSNQPYYVILTGGRNNAGDYLIKYRAKKLFKKIRPDRDIIDYNGWEGLDEEKLDIVNKAEALILMGGPGLYEFMYPKIYKLTDNIEDIKVPILTMGLGWSSKSGDWIDTHSYNFSKQTRELLDRISNSGYKSSVRDYHSLNALLSSGYQNFMMTGCPAYYDFDHINKPLNHPNTLEKVSFSPGRTFVWSTSMEKAMKNTILGLNDMYAQSEFTVVFHHSIDEQKYTTDYNTKPNRFTRKHHQLVNWLKEHNILYTDISGNAENLVEHYTNTDLHIGYRVHAHIFMSSISKLSMLITEDGRGKGLKKVFGGGILDGYVAYNVASNRYIQKGFEVAGLDEYKANKYLDKDIIELLKYESKYKYPMLSQSRDSIDNHYRIMETFIQQLP